jgi:hypothetical protein
VEFRSNSVCLFSLFICTNDVYLATKHGHSPLPTHHQPCLSPPPPFVTAHDGLNNTSSPSPIAATHIRRPRPQLPQQEQRGRVWSILQILLQSPTLTWLFLWLYMTLPVYAIPTQSRFPNILFTDFSRAITTTFGSGITLATVLTILFSLTDNSDLLNLHFRQQHPTEIGENKIQISGWIIALVNALGDKLGKKQTSSLFFDYEYSQSLWGRRWKKMSNQIDCWKT